jgi:hypothetical protein
MARQELVLVLGKFVVGSFAVKLSEGLWLEGCRTKTRISMSAKSVSRTFVAIASTAKIRKRLLLSNCPPIKINPFT